jgi:transcriptional regulator with XRE-family HTH domain
MKTIHDGRYIALITLFRRRRQLLGLRQRDVATKLGWTRSVLSRSETRLRRLDVLEVFLLGRALGITLQTVEKVLKRQRKG